MNNTVPGEPAPGGHEGQIDSKQFEERVPKQPEVREVEVNMEVNTIWFINILLCGIAMKITYYCMSKK